MPLHLKLMRLSDKEFTYHILKGIRNLTQRLRLAGYCVNEKRVRSVGHELVYFKPLLTVSS